MFAKISKKVVAVALVATMAVTTAAVASDDTASAAMKKKASVMQGKEVKLTASGSATWSSSNDNIAHCQKTKGKSIKVLGITKPFEMFWATGALSSFLDNTPTYLVFLTTAGAMHFTTGVATTLGVVPVKMLMAISCGAVFMGANTYIGNAPNFMVKSLSDENGINMPSFFGYMWWSLRYLIPVFIIDMIIFFL